MSFDVGATPDLHSFPTRRSSDLPKALGAAAQTAISPASIPARTNAYIFMAINWVSGFRFLILPIPLRCRTPAPLTRSEEHTSELQSLRHLVCRLLLEQKNAARDT